MTTHAPLSVYVNRRQDAEKWSVEGSAGHSDRKSKGRPGNTGFVPTRPAALPAT